MGDPVPGSANAIRALLLNEHGPCICDSGDCTGDLLPEDLGDPAEFCVPCSHLDPYAPCFQEEEQGSDEAQLGRSIVDVHLPASETEAMARG